MQTEKLETLRERVRTLRAERVAARLLMGSGSASMTAFRLSGQPVLGSLAHGVASDGSLVVATVRPGALAAHAPQRADDEIFTSGRLQVRLDTTLEAPEAATRIVAASAHMLGALRWLDIAEGRDDAIVQRLPEHVADLALAPGGRLGVVHATSVLIHEAAGVTRLSVPELLQGIRGGSAPESAVRSGEMLDFSMSLSRDQLSLLADAVVGGYRSGYVLTEKASVQGCSALAGRAFVVDVDEVGLTIMHVGQKTTTVVLALFDADASSEEQTTTVARCRAGLARLGVL